MGPGRKPRKEPGGDAGPPSGRVVASMGPGRKPRKEQAADDIGKGRERAASMGPGRKPRKERPVSAPAASPPSCFNGAWAKTQEGTTALALRA